eukprot:TRINITY_DN31142_c0_g1_i1.p1 TRINITY_DN31142_c0_g1~~TRINITY_DN31142_c0_g1_i1.p1  ORF type:complete len:573 (-),score=118.26 TRINITY_DN31142_c0_g1_i1:360-2078(-)
MTTPERPRWKCLKPSHTEGPEDRVATMETGRRVKEEPEDDVQDGPVKAVRKTVRIAAPKTERGKIAKGKSKVKPKAKVKTQLLKRTSKIKKNFVPKRRSTGSAKAESAGMTKVKKEPGTTGGKAKREPAKRERATSTKAKQSGKVVKVKKELNVRMKVKKEPPEKTLKVKKEFLKVKKEFKGPAGLARTPKEHFRHQVGFIEQVITGPWDVCFGGLGTGIVGVVPRGLAADDFDAPAAEPPTQAAVVSASASSQPLPDSEAAGEEEAEAEEEERAAGEEDGHVGGASSSSSSAPAASLVGRRAFTKDVVIILFKNAPNCKIQSRNLRSLGCYSGGLDAEAKTLSWESQRADKNSKKLNTIVSHVGRAGRVLVAVRPPSSKPGSDDCDYRMLGQVTRMDGLHDAECLVEEGDSVIQERGSKTVHKAISPACLSASLRTGVGLCGVTYTKSRFKLCASCSFSPARAVLHFDHLEPVGINAYQLPKGAKLEQAESSQGCKHRIVKRIRVKRAPDEDEAPGSSQSPARQGAAVAPPLAVVIKREPTDEAEYNAEGAEDRAFAQAIRDNLKESAGAP